jgi:cation transport regulator ChaB
MPAAKIDLPATLQRSPKQAQRTYRETLRHAYDEYDGDEEVSHRVAYSALKHSFKKVGDHWEPKAKRGPSDPQAAKSGPAARNSSTPTAGGKEVGTTKRELMEQARREDIPGRSKMSKDELVRALGKAGRRRH